MLTKLNGWFVLYIIDAVRKNGVAIDDIITEGFSLRFSRIKDWHFKELKSLLLYLEFLSTFLLMIRSILKRRDCLFDQSLLGY